MRLLRQSTQTDELIGPLVDDADGVTPNTTIAYNATGMDVDVYKGIDKTDVSLTNSAGVGYWRHRANGYYGLTLSTIHTDTLGPLRVSVNVDGAAPCWEYFMVIPQPVYDALVAGSDNLAVDSVKIDGSTVAATAVKNNIANLNASIAGLNNISAADVKTQAGAALTDYKPPTKTEMDSAFNALSIPTVSDIDTKLSAEHGAGSWEGGGAAPTVEQIDARLSNMHGAGMWTDSGVACNAPTAQQIDAELTAKHGAGSWTTQPPVGDKRVVRYWMRWPEFTGAPMPGVKVVVTTDPAGEHFVTQGVTNDNGLVVFTLDKGTRYYLWRSKAGYSFENPDIEDTPNG